jgi:hypothetical protein
MRAMRKWATLLLLAGTSLPAMGAKTMPLEQFEQLLAGEQGKSDERVAERISDVELTERVSLARLTKWEKEFKGERTREALIKLADEAAFREAPATDVLRDPAPDSETQEKMLALAADYVRTTMTRLPNFYATRTTTHFEDEPQQLVGDAGNALMRGLGSSFGRDQPKPLRRTGTFIETVTYRDGHELHEERAGEEKSEDQPATGMTTSGEFGPILSVVMGDVMRSQAEFARWEQGTSDPVAVFQYSVPEEQSNYLVGIPNGTKLEDVDPGYRGEIAIDPATGAILRMTVVVDLGPLHQLMKAAMLVEYAPVEIGDRTYICPVHGVAFSKMPVTGGKAEPESPTAVQTRLNDVAFTQYHLFRADARMVEAGSGANGAAPSATGTATRGTDAAPVVAPAASPPGTPADQPH